MGEGGGRGEKNLAEGGKGGLWEGHWDVAAKGREEEDGGNEAADGRKKTIGNSHWELIGGERQAPFRPFKKR